MNPLLRPDEAAAALSVSRRTVYELARSGAIASVAVGASLRFRSEDIEAFVTSHLRGAEGREPEALRGGGRRLSISVPRKIS